MFNPGLFSNNEHKEPSKLSLHKDSWVQVNIWPSIKNKALNGANVGHVSIMLSNNNYISLWPFKHHQTKLPKKMARYIQTRPANFMPSYEADCVAEAVSEDFFSRARKINHINEAKTTEIPVLVKQDDSFEVISSQPKHIEASEYLLAVTPIYATARITLYSISPGVLLTLFKIFKNQAETGNVGWRLIGRQGFLMQRIGHSSENCASLALHLLKEAGMYRNLSSLLPLTDSSIAKPDIALKHLILAKDNELKEYSDTREWVSEDDTSIDYLKQAFHVVGQSITKINPFEQIRK